jgi:hypothetical protein
MGILAMNVIVCALYYGIVNQTYVGGTSFLLQGGCALILAMFVWGGRLSCEAHVWTAAAVAASLLAANAVLQLQHERSRKNLLYPSCEKFSSPIWRLLVMPAAGGCLAACLAWTAARAPRPS